MSSLQNALPSDDDDKDPNDPHKALDIDLDKWVHIIYILNLKAHFSAYIWICRNQWFTYLSLFSVQIKCWQTLVWFVFNLEMFLSQVIQHLFLIYILSFLATASQAMWLGPFAFSDSFSWISASSFLCLHIPITASLYGSLMEMAGRRWVPSQPQVLCFDCTWSSSLSVAPNSCLALLTNIVIMSLLFTILALDCAVPSSLFFSSFLVFYLSVVQ